MKNKNNTKSSNLKDKITKDWYKDYRNICIICLVNKSKLRCKVWVISSFIIDNYVIKYVTFRINIIFVVTLLPFRIFFIKSIRSQNCPATRLLIDWWLPTKTILIHDVRWQEVRYLRMDQLIVDQKIQPLSIVYTRCFPAIYDNRWTIFWRNFVVIFYQPFGVK